MKEAASSEAEPMSEDEAASSAEEASDEVEEESEEEESDSDAPKVELPNRTTRGKRMVLDQGSGEEQIASCRWACRACIRSQCSQLWHGQDSLMAASQMSEQFHESCRGLPVQLLKYQL